MSTLALYSKIESLPESLKKQVLDYIEFLLSRESKGKSEPELKHSEALKKTAKKPLKAGFLKGSFVMAADFEEPLEDFKEYMQ
jgi:hypothetical protein